MFRWKKRRTAGWSSNVLHFTDASPRGRDEKEALDNIKEAITALMWAEDQKAVRAMPPRKSQLVFAV
ncbi:MAG TPA: hypothetical protein VGD64_16815 [Acidisarcina sp.]